ncbi:MAG: ABC transporter substrate-binding protein [Peptococcaceae bacterium]|nr:ABC transporter substrate-binding protein [Peptococcaceae bacterium]
MKKSLSILLICLMAIGLLAGCGGDSGTTTPPPADNNQPDPGAASGTPKTDIVLAIQGEPTTMDPQYPDDGNMRTITWSVFEPLYKLNGDTLEPEPCLATGYENIDELTWQFTIRDGVKFHDGGDFTVDDAVFSVNRIIDPDFGSQILSDFETIKEAVKVDDKTFQIITQQPDPILLKRLTKLDMVDKEFTEAHTNEQLTLVANGTGPYKLDHWTRGVEVVITRNPEYWGEQPVLEKATYRFIEEVVTRSSALKTGEIDLAVNMYPEYVADLPQVLSGPGVETYWVRFNQFSGLMVNKELRQAMNYAIDREGIADALFAGYARPCEGQMGRDGYFGYSDKVSAYPYDVAKAKELMAQAGYNGEVIQLLSERGRWLKDGEVTEAVAANLTEAGFNIETKFVSWNEWLDILFDRSKTPDLQFSSTSNEFFDMDRTYSAILHSTGTQTGVVNAEYDKMIEEAKSEMDPAKREAIYDELVQKLYDDPFAIYLLILDDLHGGAANLNWKLREDSRIYISEMSFS